MTTLRTRNKAHAKYEAACGLDDIIGLLYPELRARAAIDGKAFPCPICGPEKPSEIAPGLWQEKHKAVLEMQRQTPR